MRRNTNGPFHFYDLEGKRWSTPLSASAVLADGTKYFWAGPDSFKRLATFMIRTGGTWVAHYGGGYDHLLMIPHLGRIRSAILVGSKLLSADMVCGVTLLDSFPGWLCGLAEIGKYVNRPKIDHNRARLSLLSPEEMRAYVVNDSLILRDGWELADKVSADLGMRRKKTAGSAAIEALRVLEPDTYASFSAHRVEVGAAVDAQGIAPGGRTEIFRRGRVDGVHCFDIKSSYPARYLDPDGMAAGLVRCDHPKREWDNPHAVLRVMWDRKPSPIIAPVLAAGGFGAGQDLTAWVCYDERVLMDEDTDTKNVRVVDGYIPEVVLPDACKDFTRELFALKAKGIPFIKVWYNSLHGKFAENPIKDTWDSIYPDECFMPDVAPPQKYDCGLWRFGMLDVGDDGLCKPHIQPINAALVFGRARAHITRMIRDIQLAGFIVFYTDTDSIFTNASPADMRRILRSDELGNELGQLAYEGGPFSGYILGRKLYWLENDDGTKIKSAAKGVSLKSMAHAQKRLVGPSTSRHGVFLESRSDFGTDMRREIFREASEGKATVVRTGLTPFVSGARKNSWPRFRMPRRITETPGGKVFVDGVGTYVECP